ncbi:LytR/AlgR family response regulator transcription factor [Flavobacterium litorale]|uniref:LytTR family transcriptional regulator n=1 Tax=Flavobacterium litorale TaxID=2856519 RepID=A0ABX8V6Y7_9FLAO|nr:LytTR family DNA-binding domain-containing protein [Flavobacterium litorale]QYJ68613.1 LytTR family transcriptional regulator [Flavobacterium litorale]
MSSVKVILAFLFSTLVYGQQVNSFITKAIKTNPSKAIDSLAGVTSVTAFEAAKNYYVLGKCHEYLNQEDAALNYYITSKKAFKALGKVHYAKQIAFEAHLVIVSQEHYYNQYGNSFFEEYKNYADSTNAPLHKAYVTRELAADDYYAYFETGNTEYLDSAYILFGKALRYANTTNDDLIKAKLYSNIGSLKNTMRQCDSARFYLNKSKTYTDKIDDPYQRYGYYQNYANSYFFEGNYPEAIPYFLKAENEVPYYKAKAIRKLYKQLATSYDSLNNNTERRRYEKLYRELDEQIKDRVQNVKINESYIKYDVAEKEEKISIQKKVISNFEKNGITYGIVLFLVFLLALYSFVRWKKVDRSRKKIEQEKEGIEAEHLQTIEQLEKVKQLVVEEHIILKNKVKMPLGELMYIKSEDHYLNFVPFEGKSQFLRGKISEIVQELPPNFVKCHRSYIVNKNYIKSNTYKSITLQTGEEIPVSRNFKL